MDSLADMWDPAEKLIYGLFLKFTKDGCLLSIITKKSLGLGLCQRSFFLF